MQIVASKLSRRARGGPELLEEKTPEVTLDLTLIKSLLQVGGEFKDYFLNLMGLKVNLSPLQPVCRSDLWSANLFV